MLELRADEKAIVSSQFAGVSITGGLVYKFSSLVFQHKDIFMKCKETPYQMNSAIIELLNWRHLVIRIRRKKKYSSYS